MNSEHVAYLMYAIIAKRAGLVNEEGMPTSEAPAVTYDPELPYIYHAYWVEPTEENGLKERVVHVDLSFHINDSYFEENITSLVESVINVLITGEDISVVRPAHQLPKDDILAIKRRQAEDASNAKKEARKIRETLARVERAWSTSDSKTIDRMFETLTNAVVSLRDIHEGRGTIL